jgi:hypothetical protein
VSGDVTASPVPPSTTASVVGESGADASTAMAASEPLRTAPSVFAPAASEAGPDPESVSSTGYPDAPESRELAQALAQAEIARRSPERIE